MAPDEQTVVVLELPCHLDDENWTLSKEALGAKAEDLLATQDLITDSDEIVAFEQHTVSYAYPILEVGSETKAKLLQSYLESFENLSLLGRSARFRLYARPRSLRSGPRNGPASFSPTGCGPRGSSSVPPPVNPLLSGSLHLSAEPIALPRIQRAGFLSRGTPGPQRGPDAHPFAGSLQGRNIAWCNLSRDLPHVIASGAPSQATFRTPLRVYD